MSSQAADSAAKRGGKKSRAWGMQHHFESYAQQAEASYFGMWLFLAQEIMFFGGLFTAYIVYRTADQLAFAAGSHELDPVLGAQNTAILLGSSLTMALAVWAAKLGKKNLIVVFVLLTILLGGAFLGVKYVEYSAKWEHHLVPGPHFDWHGSADGTFTPETVNPGSVQMFFNLYFAMTGLHALHMVVGMGILLWMAWAAWRGAFTPENHNFVEGMGLYWHFVDVVWIFLYPLLYLLGRS